MSMLMENKAGYVTGAGSGIGRASAIAMAENGAKVVVSDVNEEAANETIKMIEDIGGIATFYYCDVTDEDQVKSLVDYTVKTYGKLDFAHNNAGFSFTLQRIGDTTFEDWDKTIKLTLYGTFYCIKHSVNAMVKNGGGAIVNTISTAGIEGVENMPGYVAAKHGITGLTKSVALEYGQDNIRINGIAPGATLTTAIENWREMAPEQYEAVLKSIPSGEIALPEDQGNAAMFLCSNIAEKISGIILPVDSGYAAGKMG